MYLIMSSLFLNRCYGGGQSVRAWQRNRLATSFETKHSAKERREVSDELDPVTKVKKKDHTGNFDKIAWDKEALKLEVEGFEDNHFVNWTNLAKRHNICNKAGQIAGNGGQIVKEWLILQGVNVTRFEEKQQHTNESPIIRRQKRKGQGGELSVPIEVSPEKLKKQMKEKIKSGEYTVGEMIVPEKVVC